MITYSSKFLASVFCLGLFIVTPFVLDDLTYNYVLHPSLQKLSRETLIHENPEVIFIGSSRFYSGIRPDALPVPSVILSLPFMNAFYMNKIVQANLTHLKKAKYVVIEVSPEGFAIDSVLMISGQNRKLRDLGVDRAFDWQGLLSFQTRGVQLLFPNLLSFRWNPAAIEYHYKPSLPQEYDHLKKFGYLAQIQKDDPQDSTEKWRTLLNERISQSFTPLKNSEGFEDMLLTFIEHEIDAAFIMMPVVDGYRNWRAQRFSDFYSKVLQRSEVKNHLLDFTRHVESELFADSNHLDPKGALKITKAISGEILKSGKNN